MPAVSPLSLTQQWTTRCLSCILSLYAPNTMIQRSTRHHDTLLVVLYFLVFVWCVWPQNFPVNEGHESRLEWEIMPKRSIFRATTALIGVFPSAAAGGDNWETNPRPVNYFSPGNDSILRTTCSLLAKLASAQAFSDVFLVTDFSQHIYCFKCWRGQQLTPYRTRHTSLKKDHVECVSWLYCNHGYV